MSEIVLVRHASTSWSGLRYCGRSDPSLSPSGYREAAVLGATLAAQLGPDARIVTSSARRAVATAAAIVQAAGLAAPHVDDRWAEADFGAVEGRTFDELASLYPALAARVVAGDPTIDWPGGETAGAFASRVLGAWESLAGLARQVVVVTHGGPIRLVQTTLDGRPPAVIETPRPGGIVQLTLAEPAPTP